MGFPESDAVPDHGGSLERARRLFPRAPEPWIDLSTGISPHSYPLFDLPATALTRLPEPGLVRELARLAAAAYAGPSDAHVVVAPGTQMLLPLVYSLRAPGKVRILGPTYAEHRRAAALSGHDVSETSAFKALAEADIAVVVNPNNPDGRVTSRERLLALAEALRERGGILVVDEAFMDVGPRQESLAPDVAEGGIVVLRSFGKFFGLAGLRLGFAIADVEAVRRLEAALGPWAVAGPALEYGLRGLTDRAWQERARVRLAGDAARLDRLLGHYGIAVEGGTSLFRHVVVPEAPSLFEALGKRGILLRSFAGRPRELRFGLPGPAEDWRRLEAALAAWAEEARPALRQAGVRR